MPRQSSFRNLTGYMNIQSCSTLSKLLTTVVIGTIALATASCSSIGGKSWSESLTDGRQAIKSQDYAKAETSLQAAIDQSKMKFGQNAGQTATCMTELAEMYMAQQEYRKAAKVFKELVPVYEKLEPGSQDALRVEAEYQDVKKKIKKYQLEPDEVEPSDAAKTDAAKTDAKTDAAKTDAKTDAAKTDAAKTDPAKSDVAKPEGAKTDSKTDTSAADVKRENK